MKGTIKRFSVVLVFLLFILGACYSLGVFGIDNARYVNDMFFEAGDFTYSGGLKHGKFNGDGLISMQTGESYSGGFDDGRFSGNGHFSDSLEGWSFSGLFETGEVVSGQLRSTDGIMVGYNGSDGRKEDNIYFSQSWQYTGALSELGQTGEGTFVTADGFVYSGGFTHGLADGEGSLTDAGGVVIYEGSFENGYFSGFGCYHSPEGWTYEGGFKDGLFDGEGVVTLEGGVVRGVWKKGVQTTRYE